MMRYLKAFVVLLMLSSSYSLAETKVVVIPMGGEEASPEKGLEFVCQALEFFPASSSTTYSGTELRSASSNLHCPVDIPVGATITKLTAYYRDQNNDFNVSCILSRGDLASAVASTLLGVTNTTQGNSASIQEIFDDTIGQPVILSGHSYTVSCAMYPSIEIKGAIITYDM